MVNRIGAWWEWVKGEIVPILSILGFVIVVVVFMWGRWSLVGRLAGGLTNLAGRFANLLVMYWMDLVLVVFGILVWILHRRVYRLKRHTGASFRNFQKDITTLHGRVSHLESGVAEYFEDDFKKDLDTNWDYRGQWEPVPGGGLSVTQSGKGGITRVGHSWMDYNFEFTAVIVKLCIAWIVRAQDLSNYYMIQLDRTRVRPHLWFAEKWVTPPERIYEAAIDSKDHGLASVKPNQPMEIRTEVRGWEIRVYVNDEQVYHKEDFFSVKFVNQEFVLAEPGPGALTVPPFITGRVGFRVSATEHGKFFRCRVRPL